MNSRPSEANKASGPPEANKLSKATKASKPGKEGIGDAIIRKVKKATCLGEPEVLGSETDLIHEDKGQGDSPDTKVQPQAADEGPSVEELITNELNPNIAKKFKELNKKLAKRAAKKAAKEAAQVKENERREKKRLEKQLKEEKKRARKEAKQEKKRAQWQQKLERKAARVLEKQAKKGTAKAASTSSSGLGDSFAEQEHKQRGKKAGSKKKKADTSPVSASSDNNPTICHKSSQDLGQSPPSGSPLPPGSPEHELVCSVLTQTSENAIPNVEEPLNSADDVDGMSYRSPSHQRQSPITVQQRHSRSSSPARLVSPTSSVTKVLPQASRTPHPPSGYPRTDYIPSVPVGPTPRRFSKTGALDNSQGEKSRFSRYGNTDINANTRIDHLSSLHVKHNSPSNIQQQTRQQPLRAVHPQPEQTITKNPNLSHLHGNLHFQSEEDDLTDDIVNLQIDDHTPGSLSPSSSTTPSRRSSFSIGQRPKVSSTDLKCPPIAGASPPECSDKSKMTRFSSGCNAEYKPNFPNALINQASASIAKVPSRTKVTPRMEDHSKSEGDKETEPKASRQCKPAFTSAQHSVLGTGRTGNYPDEPKLAGLVGINNMGNTCYMNAILQCLAQNNDLREYFLSDDYLKDLNHRSHREGNLARSFAELMKQLWKPTKKDPVSPSKLQAAFHRIAKHFGPGKQQDAQEFMCYFISELHEETNTAPKWRSDEPDIPDDISEDAKAQVAWDRYCAHNDSIFSRLFVGQLKSTLECQTCKNRSVTFDIFWDLSVPVPERAKPFQRRASWERNNQPTRQAFNIKDCLNKFTEAEILDGDNMVTCARCKRKRVFTKTFSIQRFPKHLVLHLKRFNGMRAKLTTHIEFPLQGLDMSRYLTDNAATTSMFNLTTTVSHMDTDIMPMFYGIWTAFKTPPLYDVSHIMSTSNQNSDKHQYDLGGVSQHLGSIMGGHYIAYAKHLNNNKWHCYDDTRVDTISETSVPSSYAYVLFYEQADHQ